jgi:hypothetical protein
MDKKFAGKADLEDWLEERGVDKDDIAEPACEEIVCVDDVNLVSASWRDHQELVLRSIDCRIHLTVSFYDYLYAGSGDPASYMRRGATKRRPTSTDSRQQWMRGIRPILEYVVITLMKCLFMLLQAYFQWKEGRRP